MQRQITFTLEPIDEVELVRGRSTSGAAGAAVYFAGIVRGTERGRRIGALGYESFQPMAEHQLNLLLDEIQKRWPIESVRVVHRLGVIKVGEPSLWVEVTSAHRPEAFAACQWLIDGLKAKVPIWKAPLQADTKPTMQSHFSTQRRRGANAQGIYGKRRSS